MVRISWLATVAVVTAMALGLVMARPAQADIGTPTYSTFISPPGTTLTQDLIGVIPGGSFTGGVAFAPDGDIYVTECRLGNGDGILYRLRQVLANLLGNAVKYSDEGAQAWLRVVPAAAEVRIEVINTGHPIAPADQARIFEKFYRGAHSRQTSRGTGLGLAISRQIAAAHGGRLWLERSDSASSVFVLTLPLLPAEGERG